MSECIFCGKQGKKSKEHLWPVWMHGYLEKEGDGYHVRESISSKNSVPIGKNKVERQGYVVSTKIRAVCKTCNNGWMSALEEATKPVLLKLINGDETKVREEDQKLLSKWIAMKVITGEHAEKGVHVTPRKDRVLLRESGKVPEWFAIYVSTHKANTGSVWFRTSHTISKSPDGPNPPLRGLNRNTQSVVFVCGKLFVYVFATREQGIESSEFVNMSGLECVHPMGRPEFWWPTQHQVSKEEMNRLAWLLNNLEKHPRYRYGGDLPVDGGPLEE